MKSSSRRVSIPAGCLRVYVQAARLLYRKLGAKAPTVAVLIAIELSDRDPQMIADDYLETRARHRAPTKPIARALRRRSVSRVLPPPDPSIEPDRN